MAVSATLKHIRMTPRKMRPVCNEIRGKEVQYALDFLSVCQRRASKPLLKLLRSAVANADRKGGINVDSLYIKELLCDQGATMKRSLPRARGMATPILKRSCHVKVVLEEKVEVA